MRNQGQHAGDQIAQMVQAVKGRADFCGEGFTAHFTFVTSGFPAVDENILNAGFAPCGTGHIRAELCLRVHVACSSGMVTVRMP